ncbi:MAG: hypothetical protein SCARUB_04883 [Candidatus Scalindua rubra]|uniref:Uncharacterized protein n=1 Tax=Candidatus Scalindua rubra TaxID=1872076 RepID=A0A1E3X380_9BACT|nr:MAG: hypothetical protein SCARUB_04883 [Candidatus Scalindua rubra]
MRVKSFYNILLLFLSVIVTLIFCELFYLGYVHFQKPLHRPSSIPNLGWELTPGAELVKDNIEGIPITYFVNLSGFRDKTKGIWDKWESDDIKIAYIGNSVTWGEGVEYKDTYSGVIESTFSKTTLPIKTANFGIAGSNTLQHFAVLKNMALQLNPNIIILGYYLNDIERRRTQKLPSILQFILRHYHFSSFLMGRITTVLENWNAQIPANLPPKTEKIIKKETSCEGYAKRIINGYGTTAWEDTKAVILSMSELCRQEGVKFGVVIFPFETQVRGICPYTPQEMLSSFLSKNGISFLDIAKIFENYSSKTKLYLEGDIGHPNNLGHKIAGESISRWLISEPEFGDVFKDLSIRN